MSESTAVESSRQKYEFKWSSNGMHSVQSKAESAHAYPSDFEQDPMAVDAGAEVVEAPEAIDLIANGSRRQLNGEYPSIDERALKTFHTSPKSRGRFFPSSGPLPSWARIGALAGWSCVAIAGAALIVSSSGLLASVRLAELGGVWAAVSALLWFIPAKLAK